MTKINRSIPNSSVGLYFAYMTSRITFGLLNRYPLRSSEDQLSCNPFFIIGSGRSGNTLLRSMLSQNSDVSIPPESYVWGRVIRNYLYYNFLPWDILSRLVLSEFEGFPQFSTWGVNICEIYPEAMDLPPNHRTLAKLIDFLYMYYARQKNTNFIRWGDKTPINTYYVNLIERVYPNAQYIHMIRDGRDVVASYLDSDIYKDLKIASKRWLTSIDIAQKFGNRIGKSRYLEIRYEELVQFPELIMKSVCNFLDINYMPEMMDFWKNVNTLGDTSALHHHNLRNPININSIGKWKTSLSITEQNQIMKLITIKLEELNYCE